MWSPVTSDSPVTGALHVVPSNFRFVVTRLPGPAAGRGRPELGDVKADRPVQRRSIFSRAQGTTAVLSKFPVFIRHVDLGGGERYVGGRYV